MTPDEFQRSRIQVERSLDRTSICSQPGLLNKEPKPNKRIPIKTTVTNYFGSSMWCECFIHPQHGQAGGQ